MDQNNPDGYDYEYYNDNITEFLIDEEVDAGSYILHDLIVLAGRQARSFSHNNIHTRYGITCSTNWAPSEVHNTYKYIRRKPIKGLCPDCRPWSALTAHEYAKYRIKKNQYSAVYNYYHRYPRMVRFCRTTGTTPPLLSLADPTVQYFSFNDTESPEPVENIEAEQFIMEEDYPPPPGSPMENLLEEDGVAWIPFNGENNAVQDENITYQEDEYEENYYDETIDDNEDRPDSVFEEYYDDEEARIAHNMELYEEEHTTENEQEENNISDDTTPDDNVNSNTERCEDEFHEENIDIAYEDEGEGNNNNENQFEDTDETPLPSSSMSMPVEEGEKTPEMLILLGPRDMLSHPNSRQGRVSRRDSKRSVSAVSECHMDLQPLTESPADENAQICHFKGDSVKIPGADETAVLDDDFEYSSTGPSDDEYYSDDEGPSKDDPDHDTYDILGPVRDDLEDLAQLRKFNEKWKSKADNNAEKDRVNKANQSRRIRILIDLIDNEEKRFAFMTSSLYELRHDIDRNRNITFGECHVTAESARDMDANEVCRRRAKIAAVLEALDQIRNKLSSRGGP